ncbi:MAG: hypothetical protein ACI8P9_004292 [Parasphingorhabdus sp.]|jgi:hypothetical protein
MKNCDGTLVCIGTAKATVIHENGSKLTIPNAELVASRVGIAKAGIVKK